jgi:hypothetical protein
VFVVSAYVNKNDTFSQVCNIEDLALYVRNDAESDVSFDSSIASESQNTTTNSENGDVIRKITLANEDSEKIPIPLRLIRKETLFLKNR